MTFALRRFVILIVLHENKGNISYCMNYCMRINAMYPIAWILFTNKDKCFSFFFWKIVCKWNNWFLLKTNKSMMFNFDKDILILVIQWLIKFIFTVIITCLSLIGVVKLADQKQQKKLFNVLIISPETSSSIDSFFTNSSRYGLIISRFKLYLRLCSKGLVSGTTRGVCFTPIS